MTNDLMKTPKEVDLSITTTCNLRCAYCFHFSSELDVPEDLPAEEWLTFFRELKECAVLSVCLQGGEPFCRRDLRQLIRGLVENNMRFAILSNGTKVTREMARFLAGTGRYDYVQVSIDGSRAAIHDTCRGRGNFDRAIKGFHTLRENGVKVAVRVTIHKGNVHDLENTAKFLLEDLELPAFGTNAAGYMGLCRTHSGFVQLDAAERTLAMETLLRLTQRYPGRISAAAGPLAEGQHWRKMQAAMRAGQDHLPRCGSLSACGCIWSKLAVRPDGVIVPCLMLSHIELGRMNKDRLRDIWQGHPELHRLRTRSGIPLTDFEFCRDCEYMNYCTGNCPGLAWTLIQNVYHPSPDACLRKFLQEGGRLPAMETVGGEDR